MITRFSRCAAVLAVAALVGPLSAHAAADKAEGLQPKKAPSLRTTSEEAAAGPSGTVVETMNASGYTYVCLEKAGAKTWVAVPETKIKVGSKMTFQPGQVMTNFPSKALNRTFDSIVFSGGVAGPGEMPTGHPNVSAPSGGATGSKAQVSTKEKNVKVEKAKGDNAYSVAEVYAKRSELDKKTVTVKGKVVKVSQGIMGRNWIHIQDGSGDQKKGTHNLVATTQDLAAKGDVVTVTGTFAKDRDFGAGYLYQAIIENATVAK